VSRIPRIDPELAPVLAMMAEHPDVPSYAAPSRAEDLAGLPTTFIAVGELDLFVDEDLDYAQRLLRAGVPMELHVYPGAFHGFDVVGTLSGVARRFQADRNGALHRALHPTD